MRQGANEQQVNEAKCQMFDAIAQFFTAATTAMTQMLIDYKVERERTKERR